jgi:hypothetical protein
VRYTSLAHYREHSLWQEARLKHFDKLLPLSGHLASRINTILMGLNAQLDAVRVRWEAAVLLIGLSRIDNRVIDPSADAGWRVFLAAIRMALSIQYPTSQYRSDDLRIRVDRYCVSRCQLHQPSEAQADAGERLVQSSKNFKLSETGRDAHQGLHARRVGAHDPSARSAEESRSIAPMRKTECGFGRITTAPNR